MSVDFDAVREASIGQWLGNILPAAGIAFRGNPNSHQPCPACGGNRPFRFDDQQGRGTFICTHCGSGDGFKLLQLVMSCDIKTAMEFAAGCLGISEQTRFSEADREAARKRAAEAQAAADLAKAQAQKAVCEIALGNWRQGKPVECSSEHAYLVAKGVQPHGTRILNGKLLIPITADGLSLINIQSIDEAGHKLFIKGGQVTGGYFLLNKCIKPTRIVVAEGFATAASLAEIMQCRVAVAFNAGNLEPVCAALRRRYGADFELLVAGDNDEQTERKNMLRFLGKYAEGATIDLDTAYQDQRIQELARLTHNPGISAAAEAAAKHGGQYMAPWLGDQQIEQMLSSGIKDEGKAA